MKLNTAIFYDIENLIGGYGASIEAIKSLSLKKIVEEIRKVELLAEGGIAIQRAYADWSNPRLGVLRSEIIDLGIEPIQSFGFGKGTAVKNNSDIQLAIDAVDIAYVRPALETFVIVSGDGGFGALAKKLHEYGKAVVGCALQGTKNDSFKAVCDHFVSLPEIKVEVKKEGKAKATAPLAQGKSNSGSSSAKESRGKEEMVEIENAAQLVEETRKILDKNSECDKLKKSLQQEGIDLSTISQRASQGIKDFPVVRLKYGFVKISDLLQRALHDHSTLKLLHGAGSDYRLVREGKELEGFERVLTNPELPVVHCEKTYRGVLMTRPPHFSLESPEILSWLASRLVDEQTTEQGRTMEEWINFLKDSCFYEESALKGAFGAFVSAGAFDCTPEGGRLFEQTLTLRIHSRRELMDALEKGARAKLTSILGEIDESVLSRLLVVAN